MGRSSPGKEWAMKMNILKQKQHYVCLRMTDHVRVLKQEPLRGRGRDGLERPAEVRH